MKTTRVSSRELVSCAMEKSTPAQWSEVTRWLNFPIWSVIEVRDRKEGVLIGLHASVSGGMLMVVYPDGKSEAGQQGETSIKVRA